MANVPEDPKIAEERMKKLLKEVAKIRAAMRDREGLRTPLARAKRKQDIVDSNKSTKNLSDRLKVFGQTIGAEVRSGVVGTVGGVVSAIPGAKTLGKAIGAATEGTAVSDIFQKFVLGKQPRTGGGDGGDIDTAPDVGELLKNADLTSESTGDMVTILGEIRDKICFIKDQMPTKLERKENKNESKMFARRNKGQLALAASRRRPGGPGGPGGGADGGFLEDVAAFAVAELGTRALLSKSVRSRALRLLTLGRFGRVAGVAGTAAAATRATSIARALPAARGAAMLPAATRGAGLAAVSTRGGKGAIDMVRGADGVYRAAQAGKLAKLSKNISGIQKTLTTVRAGLAATTPLRAASAIATFGVTEAIASGLMFGIESNIADAIAGQIQLEQGVVRKQRAFDPTTGKTYTRMIDSATGVVLNDPTENMKNIDGSSPKTRVDEKYNKRRNNALQRLKANEGHIIQSLQIAVQAHTEGDDSVANGALEAAKDLMIKRAEIAGQTGVNDASFLKKIIKFSPQGAQQMKELLSQADDMVWETEIWDQDWVDDTVDQLNAIMQGENAALMDPGDTSSMNDLVRQARERAQGIAKMKVADEQADTVVGQRLRAEGQDTSFLLSDAERQKRTAGEIANNATMRASASQMRADRVSALINSPVNNISSQQNTTNNNISSGDSQNSEPAFNNRRNEQNRAKLF